MVQAVQFSEYGELGGVQLVEVELEAPGPGEVTVESRAIGVNASDWKVVAGFFSAFRPLDLPAVPGSAAAGVITAIGPDVTTFEVGDLVVWAGFVGGYQTAANRPVSELAIKPDQLSFADAAALPGSATTGYSLVESAKIKAGEIVLVHGGAGGVGSAAVQLAVAKGAVVIATASEANHDYLRGLKAEPVSYGAGLEERIRSLGVVDVSIDAFGGQEAAEVTRALVGAEGRAVTAVPDAFAKEAGIAVVTHESDELARVLELAAEGTLKVRISRHYTLKNAADALATSKAGHLTGKLSITP